LDAIQARCDVIVGNEEAVAGGLTAVMLIILALSAGSTTQTETYTLNQGESNQMSTNNLYTGCWGDLFREFSSGVQSPNNWLNYNCYWLNYAHSYASQGMGSCRLMFQWDFAYDAMSQIKADGSNYNDVAIVLQHFDTIGMKIILDMHYCNSVGTVGIQPDDVRISSAWIALASHFAGDNRISAFNLHNEINYDVRNTHTAHQITEFYANLCYSIWAIDSSRKIIFPLGQLYYNSASEWIDDIESFGINSDSRIIFDVVHPYVHSGENAQVKAEWYDENWIAPSVSAFGSDKCWCGETFCYDEIAPNAYRSDWMVSIVNIFINYGVDFQAIELWGDSSSNALQDSAFGLTDWVPSSGYSTPVLAAPTIST
jgi:hypothetical protein